MVNIKLSTEAGMTCIIDGEIFHRFIKNTRIGDSITWYHVTIFNIGLFNVTKIKESIQGSYGSVWAIKRGKLYINVCQMDGTE